MSKKKPEIFALLKSLGMEDLPGADELAKVDEATGAKLLSQAMQATNVHKLATAEKKRDSRREVTSGLGSFGNMLSQSAGRTESKQAMDTLEGDAKLLAKSQKAIAAFDRGLAMDDRNNAMADKNLDLFTSDLDHQRAMELQRQRDAAAGRRNQATIAARGREGGLDQNQENIWLEKVGDKLQHEEAVGGVSREIVQLMNANPGLAPNQEYVANVYMSSKQGKSVAEEFQKEAHSKIASTKTYRKRLLDPETIKADKKIIRNAADGNIPNGIAGMLALEEAEFRERDRSSNIDMAEMGKEDQEAFNSRRRESISEKSFEVYDNVYSEGVANFTISQMALKQMGQTAGVQKELHTLLSRQATSEGLRIGGTTLTDFAIERITGELGDQPGMGRHNFIKAQNAHIRASQNRIRNITSSMPEQQLADYERRMEGNSVLSMDLIEMDAGPVEDLPLLDVSASAKRVNQSTEGHAGAGLEGTAGDLAKDPVSIQHDRIKGGLKSGKEWLKGLLTPGWNTEWEDKRDAHEEKYGNNQGSMLPQAGAAMQQQQPPMARPPSMPGQAPGNIPVPANEGEAQNLLAQTMAILNSQSQLGQQRNA
jgi:hypothetical protein